MMVLIPNLSESLTFGKARLCNANDRIPSSTHEREREREREIERERERGKRDRDVHNIYAFRL